MRRTSSLLLLLLALPAAAETLVKSKPATALLNERIELKPAELAMAASLVESMAADFDPSQFTDDYRVAMQAMIDDKLAGGDELHFLYRV